MNMQYEQIEGKIKRDGWGYKIYVSACEIEDRGLHTGDDVRLEIFKKEKKQQEE